mmetsp:Transcript_26306/g.62436  ORF Transcript_26306/g.62436 Transcript_26306/m.62436 type:complete len:519 (-) Transcript_26306:867-2423(-)
MVERDGARAHAAGVDAGLRRPLADAGVLLAAADHVEVEGGAGRLQLAHALLARRALGLHENRQPARAPVAGARHLRTGHVHALLSRIEPLPRRVVGPLVRQRLAHALRFRLHLQLCIAVAFLVAARLDAQRRQRIEVRGIDAQRPLHQLAVARPLLGAQPPIACQALVQRSVAAVLHLGGNGARGRDRRRLRRGRACDSGEDGGEADRGVLHGRLLWQRKALGLAVHAEHGGARLDRQQMPRAYGIAFAQQPHVQHRRGLGRRHRQEALAAAQFHAHDVERRFGHLGIGRLGGAPGCRGRRGGSLHARFEVAHARLQRLQVAGMGVCGLGLLDLRQALVQRLARGLEVGLGDRLGLVLRGRRLLFEFGDARVERLHVRILGAGLALLAQARQAHAVDHREDAHEQQPRGRCDVQPARAAGVLVGKLRDGHGWASWGTWGSAAGALDAAAAGMGLALGARAVVRRAKHTARAASSTDRSQAGPASASKASRSGSGPSRRCAAGSGSVNSEAASGASQRR